MRKKRIMKITNENKESGIYLRHIKNHTSYNIIKNQKMINVNFSKYCQIDQFNKFKIDYVSFHFSKLILS